MSDSGLYPGNSHQNLVEFYGSSSVYGGRGIIPTENGYLLPLPVSDTRSAQDFLKMIGNNSLESGMGGSMTGTGVEMQRLAVEAPRIRAEYKQAVEAMMAEITARLNGGQSKEDVARWASAERNRIIHKMRSQSGLTARGIFHVRDTLTYGRGGRTWDNMVRHYENKPTPLRGEAMYDAMLQGSRSSNQGVNQTIAKGANYLKHGGRIVLVVGVAASAARIWNASEQEMPKVLGEEIGSIAGGFLGAGVGAGICIAFGIGTLGWGLLACGVVGGVIGGYGGSKAGGAIADGWYYSDASTPADKMENISIEIPIEQLSHCMPPFKCVP